MTRDKRITTVVLSSTAIAIAGLCWSLAPFFPVCVKAQWAYPNDIEFIKGENWVRLVDPAKIPQDEHGVWVNWALQESRLRRRIAMVGWSLGTLALALWAIRGLEDKEDLPALPLPPTKSSSTTKMFESDLYDRMSDQAGLPREAVILLFDGLSLAMESADLNPGEHVTTQQYCEGISALAKDRFGDTARERLASWGWRSWDDVGRGVHALVAAGAFRFGKRQEEQGFSRVTGLDDLFGTTPKGDSREP